MPQRYLLATSLVIALSSATQAFEVDEADSLNFEQFHAVEAEERRSQPALLEALSDADEGHGEILRASVDYRIGASAPAYNAHTAIDVLHRQMLNRCSKGWSKLGESSEVITDDGLLRLSFHFRCR